MSCSHSWLVAGLAQQQKTPKPASCKFCPVMHCSDSRQHQAETTVPSLIVQRAFNRDATHNPEVHPTTQMCINQKNERAKLSCTPTNSHGANETKTQLHNGPCTPAPQTGCCCRNHQQLLCVACLKPALPPPWQPWPAPCPACHPGNPASSAAAQRQFPPKCEQPTALRWLRCRWPQSQLARPLASDRC